MLRPRLAAAAAPASLRRAFHPTRPRHNDAALGAFLTLPHELMCLLHTHLPWYATLPLTAFLFRGLLVSTAGSWTRALAARYVGLHPLRQAMAFHKRDQLLKDAGFASSAHAKRAIVSAVRKETRALDARWKCSLKGQVSWTLVQIPIFLTMAEVIRNMCGARDGLLGLTLTKVGLRTEYGTLHGVPLAPESPWFQPSLASEGMLWFPDLLVPDPTGALPFVVSALMFTNVYITKNGPADPDAPATVTRVIRKLLLGLSLLVGPLCQDVPAALMLYWAGSTSSVILWNFWLDWRYPTPKDALACKRHLRIIPPPRTRAV